MKAIEKKWMGTPPTECDTCGRKIDQVFIDGRVRVGGMWAILCPACHEKLGVGLGQGKGQKYEYRVRDGEWIKVDG